MKGIYKITNKINKKVYIGQSTNIEQRFIKHKAELRGGYHHNKHLQKAWNKYGEINFKFEIIYVVPNFILDEKYIHDLLNKLEIDYILVYDSTNINKGYNLTKGGKDGSYHTEETKKILSEKRIGKNNPMYGTHRNHSEATKQKMKNSSPNKKRVAMIDKNSNEIIRIFESLSDINIYLNKEVHANVSAVCSGRRKTAYGYKWKFVDGE